MRWPSDQLCPGMDGTRCWVLRTDLPLLVLQTATHISARPPCRLVTILAKPFKLSNCYESQQSTISSGWYCNFAPCILIIVSENNRRLWTCLSPNMAHADEGWLSHVQPENERLWCFTCGKEIFMAITVSQLWIYQPDTWGSHSHVYSHQVFWECSIAYLARGYHRFEGTCCCHLHSKRVKTDAVRSSKI